REGCASIDALEHADAAVCGRIDDVGIRWIHGDAHCASCVDVEPACASIPRPPDAGEAVPEVHRPVTVGIHGDPATAQVQKLSGRSPWGAIDAGEGFTEVGALPDAVAFDSKIFQRRDVNRMIDRVYGNAGCVVGACPEAP